MAIEYNPAPDIKERVVNLAEANDFSNVDTSRLYCFRSQGSKAKKTIARIWPFPKIWQKALFMEPRYIIEVIGERFDPLEKEKQDEILIHELKHIPKHFTGGLRKHNKKNLKKHIKL